MPFVVRSPETDRPESPEALFRSLRPRDRNVRDLLLRQGDALRGYVQHAQADADVAIELPTGGGKTLVGLLIAEWRRRALGERVAYLCPTVQLARQVALKAADYGLDVVTLVRRQNEWDPRGFTRFQRAQAVAIAGYAQIFNSNPRLNSAQTLVLDDAHAAEDAVASNWSIDAPRDSLLFRAIVAILAPHLPEEFARRLLDTDLDPFSRGEVALVPPEAMSALAGEIESALGDYATDRNDSNTYTKAMIGSALGRCLAFVSWSQLLIRPLIAPTSVHPAFAGAHQRVYMSATLGVAGELERAFAVPNVTRISSSAEDEQGFGRRLFLMPHAATTTGDSITEQAITEAGRALILTPSTPELDEAIEHLVPESTPVIRADSVEQNFDAFVRQPSAVLALANRYDGIDLPDDACRLVILSGLPAHAHLQERFIMDTLGARRVLSERIRTRIQQGAGRATRNARDFAAVIVRHQRLLDFLAREDELQAMPAQLQAEVEFGFDNSEDPDADFMALLRSFWAQDAEWQVAERALQSLTAQRGRHVSQADAALARSAEKEVLCWQAAFSGDLPRAVDLGQEVTDRLIGGDELRPYRALWFYLTASWAWQLARQDPDTWRDRARELQRETEGCARTMRWRPTWVAEPPDEVEVAEVIGRAQRAAGVLRDLGIRGSRFEAQLASVAELLANLQATSFEQGVKGLGELLGFESVRPNGQADPDAAWRDGTRMWVITEAKTEERADTPLSAETVRQAGTHEQWVANVLGWERPTTALTIIVSDKAQVDPAAAPIAGDLRLITPAAIGEVAERTFAALREARAAARGMTDDELAAAVGRTFADHRLDDEQLLAELGTRRICDG